MELRDTLVPFTAPGMAEAARDAGTRAPSPCLEALRAAPRARGGVHGFLMAQLGLKDHPAPSM